MKSGIVAGLFGLIATGLLVAGPPEKDSGKPRDRPARENQREHGNGAPRENHGQRRDRPPRPDQAKRCDGAPGERRDFFGGMLRQLDEDRNGGISFAEFSKAERVGRLSNGQRRRLFDRLDKNKDGEIRRDDIVEKGPHGRPWGGRREGNPDTNKDGKVSLEEFRKSPRMVEVPPARQEQIFRKMDRNKDGFLNGLDFRGRWPGHPGAGKPPGGGKPPPQGPFPGPELFEQLDTDEDGSLSFEEFRKGSRVNQLDEDRQEDLFEKMDRDGDGSLQSDELMGPTGAPAMRSGPGRRLGEHARGRRTEGSLGVPPAFSPR